MATRCRAKARTETEALPFILFGQRIKSTDRRIRAYLTTEMRQWEKTFPDELWLEFGRLTHWQGSVTQRPKY
jgi:hypothetical protein